MNTVVCTGWTEKEFAQELRAIERGHEVPNRCYLCRREEGDTAVSIVHADDSEERIAMPKLKLYLVERTKHSVNFHYRLCHECFILIESAGHIDIQSFLAEN